MNKKELKKIEYQSWGCQNKWTDEEIYFIISHNCKCDECEKSVLELNDFPEVLLEKNELLCENCYDEKYRKICPICEDYYDTIDGESNYSVLNEEDAKQENKIAGIYHFKKLIVPININYLKKIDCGDDCCEVYSDDICLDCVSNLVRKDNFIKCHGTGTSSLLIKKCENDFLKYWNFENLKRKRIKLIHERITIRGLIQNSNNYER